MKLIHRGFIKSVQNSMLWSLFVPAENSDLIYTLDKVRSDCYYFYELFFLGELFTIKIFNVYNTSISCNVCLQNGNNILHLAVLSRSSAIVQQLISILDKRIEGGIKLYFDNTNKVKIFRECLLVLSENEFNIDVVLSSRMDWKRLIWHVSVEHLQRSIHV